MENKRVLLGMSGGVDSSVSALLLQKQGYEVVGITMLLCSGEESQAIQDARNICKKLNIEHYVYDLQNEFKENVIKDFIKKYEECLTPNPCIKCNRYMKFGYMYQKAKELNCNYIATGHYAKKEFSEEYNKYVIKKSNAGKKDQTYVLYNIPSEMVEHVLFPLSDFESKDEIRKIATDNGLVTANKPDSQEICFIPDNDYVNFLERHNIQGMKHGKIINREGVILGKHQGLHRYTIGQRRGMGISSSTPLYVIELNKERNQIIVGKEEELYTDTVKVIDTNCILFDNFENGMKVDAKIRYSAPAKEATIFVNEDNSLTVKFDEKVRAVTPGQAIVFYINDILVGGGQIAK
ncbi:MAG: tRNA 2-thiouridine(34) synthase MnmA [Clostridia bacterium]|nr:tRNA 2-thiouridine(34) synthase MnmA [Clostridia bacterium]